MDDISTNASTSTSQDTAPVAIETSNTTAISKTDNSVAESAEIARLKNALTKTNSENADLKKQLRAKMSDDEAAAAAREEQLAKLQQQIDESNQKVAQLEKEKLESVYKAKYLATAGFDEALAEETAKALVNGDMDKVFANQQKANEAAEKKLRAELVKQDPKPGGNGNGSNEEADNVRQAREIGKQKAEALKAGNSLDKFKI